MALQGCLRRKMIWGENSRKESALDRSAFTEAIRAFELDRSALESACAPTLLFAEDGAGRGIQEKPGSAMAVSKLNIPFNVRQSRPRTIAIRPRLQLSSMKRRTDAWSVTR